MRDLLLATVAATLIVGCEWNSASTPADAHAGGDARRRVDAGDDADNDGATASGHLLLSEITLAPAGSEFIEITNPTAQAIPLADTYLSDNGNYFKLPLGSPTVAAGDFIVKFPTADSVAAGGTITVALGTAAAFTTAFGAAPTYSIAGGTVTLTAGSATPSLTDTGEIVVLFQWDGSADLVADVDVMIAGAPTGLNGLVSKSGVTQGASTYATDANTIAAQSATPGTGKSTKRIALEDGNETQAGTGNGVTGDDETSEATGTTWDSTFTAPTPGVVPAL